jgi:N-acetyl-anhydromuramyl-L-alanine amidase AmpD
MIDPEINHQVRAMLHERGRALDQLLEDPNASVATKAEARAQKAVLDEEQRLRDRWEQASTPNEQEAAEFALAEHRDIHCANLSDDEPVTKCQRTTLRVHLHARCLFSPEFVASLRDPKLYPNRVAHTSEGSFQRNYSFEGASLQARRRGHMPDDIGSAIVTIAGLSATSDQRGVAEFVDVPPGTYTVAVRAPNELDVALARSEHEIAEESAVRAAREKGKKYEKKPYVPPTIRHTMGAAGPGLPVLDSYDHATAPRRMFRWFEVSVHVAEDGGWSATPRPEIHAAPPGPPYAGVVEVSGRDLYLDWRPVWFKVTNRYAGSGTVKSCVVLHGTATTEHERVSSPLYQFDNKGRKAAHYLVDLDGHVIKLVHEEEECLHAGSTNESHWQGLVDLNVHGIGIETVHTDYNQGDTLATPHPREYTSEQYAEINRLLAELRTAFNISRTHVCAHNDCRDGVRDCPGIMFDWPQLEIHDHVLEPLAGEPYTGSREVVRTEKVSPASTSELVRWLYEIGYSHKTVEVAMGRFWTHYHAGSRRGRTSVSFEPIPSTKTTGKPAPTAYRFTQLAADMLAGLHKDIPTPSPK